jgi:uncharacterized protein (DUF169 family)
MHISRTSASAMTDQANRLEELLGLTSPPLAIAFRDTPPVGVSRIDSVAPSGCTYWKLAAQGHIFYTAAADHYNCPVGAYTHGIALPTERKEELDGLMGMMLELKYLQEEDTETIPRRAETFGVAVYAPWSLSPCEPDVVIVQGSAKQVMLLWEAARAAGIHGAGEMMGRPTCAMIPATIQRGRATISLGCIGNRVYNEVADDQLYAALPAQQMNEVIKYLETVVEANRQLEKFHRERLASISD